MWKFFHPFLFSIFPVLSLYASNVAFVRTDTAIKSIVIMICVTLIILFAVDLIVKSKLRASLITSWFIFLFFLYGRVVPENTTADIVGILIFLTVLLYGAILLALHKKIEIIQNTNFLNKIAIILVMIPLIQIGMQYFNTGINAVNPYNELFDFSIEKSNLEYPDIYFIILDGHARQDILKDIYNYDNSWFIEELRLRGFYVADYSTSNYSQTYLTLASIFNMSYLTELADQIKEQTKKRTTLQQVIDDSLIFHKFKDAGYVIIIPKSGWAGADELSVAGVQINRFQFGEFENELINTTPIRVIWTRVVQQNIYRNRINKIIKNIKSIANLNMEKKFVYAHILSPHAPFLFDENGNSIKPDPIFVYTDPPSWSNEKFTSEKYRYYYPKELEYIDKKILEVIDKIVKSNSIILIQGDHGPASLINWEDPADIALQERMSILNAYYFPGKKYDKLYPSITPVNSFRVILDTFFNTNLGTIEDKNYYSTWDLPLTFNDVTDIVQPSRQSEE